MGSVGDAYDNAMAESFFSTLEAELLSRRRFASQAEAKMACFSYIEGWYNPVRLHSALGYRSPMAYEASMQTAKADTQLPSPQTVHEIGATSDRSHLASLNGIVLNVVTELDASGRMPGGALLKQVASHEAVTTRHPHERGFTYLSRVRNLWATNAYPRFRDTDPYLLRRLMVLEVPPLAPEKMDPDFLEKACEQAAGILLVLVEQVEKLAEAGRFTAPRGGLERALRLQFPDEPAEIVARAHVEAAPRARITSSAAQAALRRQAKRMGIDIDHWSDSTGMKTWAQAVATLYGAVRRKSQGDPFYEGIRFKEGYEAMLQGHPDPAIPANEEEVVGLDAL